MLNYLKRLFNMSDLSKNLIDIVNKIHLLQNSYNYIIDNSNNLPKDDFIITSIASSSELEDIQKKLNLILDTL